MEMLQILMRNFSDRYHSVWWCSLVRFTIYFSSVVVLSFGEVCEGGHRNWIHLCFTTPHILTIPLLIMHSWSFGSFTTKNMSQLCVNVFSSFSSSYSRYGVRSVHFIPIGAFWHILPVLFFCHCNYHPHRSICEAQEFLPVGNFNSKFPKVES